MTPPIDRLTVLDSVYVVDDTQILHFLERGSRFILGCKILALGSPAHHLHGDGVSKLPIAFNLVGFDLLAVKSPFLRPY